MTHRVQRGISPPPDVNPPLLSIIPPEKPRSKFPHGWLQDPSKFALSQMLYLIVEFEVVQDTTLMYIRAINYFSFTWILQDEYLVTLPKTTNFCCSKFVNLVDIKENLSKLQKLVEGIWLVIVTSNLLLYPSFYFDCTKKLSLPLTISSVNLTKSARNCEFGHIYERNP